MDLSDLHFDVGHGRMVYGAQLPSVGRVDIFCHIAVGELDSLRIVAGIVFNHGDAARFVRLQGSTAIVGEPMFPFFVQAERPFL